LPTHRFKFSGIAFVAEDVALAFILPKYFAGLGDDFPISAIMYVPETAVNEDYLFVSDKDNVGSSG
jgi:hypothetical protein